MSKTSRGIAGVFVFLLSFFLLDRLAFHLIKNWERTAFEKQSIRALFVHQRSFYKNFFSLPRNTFNTVIMGSSRTHRGIHPYYLFKYAGLSAFKNASAKCKPKFNYFFYQRYKKHAAVPSLLVYGLDYFMFMMKTKAPFLRRFTGKDETALDAGGISLLWSNKAMIDELLGEVLDSLAGDEEGEHVAGSGRRLKDLPRNAAHIDPFVGYPKVKPISKVRPPVLKKNSYMPFPGKEGEWFLKLLRELERDGVKVVLVNLPEYIGTYESNFQREKFISEIRRLARPFKNVHFFDYNRPDRFDLANDAYFLDGGYGLNNSHLSYNGARILNRRLASDIKKLLGR